MPRKLVFTSPSANPIPQLRHHRPSGRAVVTLNGRDIYVGAWGTVAARTEYNRTIGRRCHHFMISAFEERSDKMASPSDRERLDGRGGASPVEWIIQGGS